MLSKNKAKFIKSLHNKKAREESGFFTVEGAKSVLEILGSRFEVTDIVCTEPFRNENRERLEEKNIETVVVSPEELESVSSFKTANSVLAVARMIPNRAPEKLEGLTLALDNVRDPGNFGTLLRVADWFGVYTVIASEGTVELYNPKVLQASMGSFCRVQVHYADLERFFENEKSPVYAADTKGENVHDFPFEKNCILLLGNESHGLSAALRPCIKRTVSVPAYGGAESLNVSTAAAILCDNYRRMRG
jgi:TrmH family RNA methyltransferase